jgi:hypothetical protein
MGNKHQEEQRVKCWEDDCQNISTTVQLALHKRRETKQILQALEKACRKAMMDTSPLNKKEEFGLEPQTRLNTLASHPEKEEALNEAAQKRKRIQETQQKIFLCLGTLGLEHQAEKDQIALGEKILGNIPPNSPEEMKAIAGWTSTFQERENRLNVNFLKSLKHAREETARLRQELEEVGRLPCRHPGMSRLLEDDISTLRSFLIQTQELLTA